MPRHVRGFLFVDYVRMIRGNKKVDWSQYLEPEDAELLAQHIDPEGWYPMETFERYGLGIVREVAGGQLAGVEMWGRFQLEYVRAANPELIAADDPRGTFMRFRSLQRSFFDYDAVEVDEVLDQDALVSLRYGMGIEAERAACHQTLGFCARMVECAGGQDVTARFESQSWEGSPRTRIAVRWR